MARKSITFTLQDGERTLKFKATQMPATKQERFLLRLAAAILHGGIANSFDGLPDGKGLSDLSWSDINMDELFKALGNVNLDDVEALANDLLTCCALITSDGVEQDLTPETIDAVVEDVKTLFLLKKKAFEVNFMGFRKDGSLNETTEQPSNNKSIHFSKKQ